MLNLQQLNEAQYQAVTYGEGPLLILAGPGSGKTHTITQRIFYLLQKRQVEPQRILVITFTRDAALSMKNRFYRESDINYPINFATFHSIFYHILKKSPEFKRNKIISEVEKSNIIKNVLKDLGVQLNEIESNYNSLIDAISLYKNTNVLDKTKLSLEDGLKEKFQDIFKNYQYVMKKNGYIDFDDMIFECKNYLRRNTSAREYWKNQFDYILIDEFQDINQTQYEIIKLISKAPYNIFAVGDDDQSIYGFRGASPSCLVTYKNEYNADEIILNINYRSKKKIVDCAACVINENKNRFLKKMCSYDNYADGQIKVEGYDNVNDLIDYLRKNKIFSMNTNKTVAFIFRTNTKLILFAKELDKIGVAYNINSSKLNKESFIYKDLVSYIRLGTNNFTRDDFIRVMNHPSRYISRECVPPNISCFEDLIKHTKDALIIDKICKIRQQSQRMYSYNPQIGFNYFMNCINYKLYIQELIKKNNSMINVIEAELASLKAYINRINKWDDLFLYNQLKNNDNSNVFLMTAHASKGLEFDKVIIIECNEGTFPYGKFMTDDYIEEERRLFYVALTRAKESLELYYLKNNKSNPRLVSRFLNPLLKLINNK